MKKLNITKEAYNKSRYFTSKYGKMKYVSESGKVYKTSKGNVIKFVKESDNEDLEKEFKCKGVSITRYDYESLPCPMAASKVDDKTMQKIANYIYEVLLASGWTEEQISKYSDIDEIADNDPEREMFQDDWWRFMEREAVTCGMPYYEDLDEDDENMNESLDDIDNDPAYQCPYCGGHNCEFVDVDDEVPEEGYFDGSTIRTTFQCNDCEDEYRVNFKLHVDSVE